MSLRIISGLLLGAYGIGNGLWVLVVQPDPPPTARTATRKFRQIVAIGSVIIGVLLIALFVSDI